MIAVYVYVATYIVFLLYQIVELVDTDKKVELQKEVFTNCRQHIVEYLSPDDIVDHLISKHLIGDSARQQLSLPKTTQEKNRIIVDGLSKGGPDALEKFCVILKKNSRTKHISDRLEEGTYIHNLSTLYT